MKQPAAPDLGSSRPADAPSERQVFAVVSLIFLGVLLAATVYRAATQSITTGEAVWFQGLTDPHGAPAAESPAGLAFDSLLARGCIHAFGVSEFTLRLPGLLGGLIFFFAIFRLCRLLFGDSVWLPLAIALVTLNPPMLDICSGLSGGGLGLAFWTLGLYYVARWVADRETVPIGAGVALGLAVAFALASVFAVAALATVFVGIVLADRLLARDLRGAFRFAVRDALAFCLAIFLVAAGILWRLPHHGGLTSADAVMRHYKDGLQALVSACLLYRPVLWTSPAAIHRLVERLGWLLPLAVLAGLAAAGGHAGLRWMRARSLAAVDRQGRLSLFFAKAAGLTLVLLWAEPRIAHHKYYAQPEFLFALLPVFIAGLLPLARLMAGPRRQRALACAGAGVFCLLLLHFAMQFNLYSYYGREADAGLRRVVTFIRQRHAADPNRTVTLAADGYSQASRDFYRRLYEMDWMEQAHGDDTGCQADYYYLPEARFDRMAADFGLRAIYRDAAARAVLAEPGTGARGQLAVARSLGFAAPRCNTGVFVKDAWADSDRAGAARHFLRDVEPGADAARWRWTNEKPVFLFYLPARPGVRFKMDFVIHSQTFKATGPLRMTVRINGKELGQAVYNSPEQHTFEQAVPPEMLRADGMALVETALDKYYVSPGDAQKLGYLFVRGGFIY